MLFRKNNIAKNDTTATKEWPPVFVHSNCSNLQLSEGEIYDFCSPSFEVVFLGLGVVYSCDFCCRDSPRSVITRQQTTLQLNINYSLYTLFCLQKN